MDGRTRRKWSLPEYHPRRGAELPATEKKHTTHEDEEGGNSNRNGLRKKEETGLFDPLPLFDISFNRHRGRWNKEKKNFLNEVDCRKCIDSVFADKIHFSTRYED
jgi:hypothetical protein